jgi:hypothetical protein
VRELVDHPFQDPARLARRIELRVATQVGAAADHPDGQEGDRHRDDQLRFDDRR